jgi:two-component system cell cycle response regulator
MYNILHIDNSSFFIRILNEAFTPKGYTCIEARDIDDAFDALHEHEIDLIITAMELRGGNGEFLITQLNNSIFKDIPVIIITSNDSLEERNKMFSLGVIDYIYKDKNFASRLMRFVKKLTEENKTKTNLKRMSIAVLDDSKLEQNIIRNILSINGLKKVDYYNNAESLLAQNKMYQIYLVDLILPGISGEQVILELRKKYRNAIIIAISGVDNYKVISNILLSGADDYILKPFNSSLFMARLIADARGYVLLKELEKKNMELKQISITDSMTNLYNHTYIFKRLEDEIDETKALGSSLAIIKVSIDLFNLINDRFGHQAGDKVLTTIADLLKKNIGENDILGRYGGVEFLIILPGYDLEGAYLKAEELRKRASKIALKDHRISISGGVAQLGNKNENAMELLKKADSLLFNARKHGKNKIEKNFNWSL